MSENTNLTETIKVRLTLDVTYELNGENATEMVGRLRRMRERAIGEGMLTGETDAEVNKYSMDAVIQPEPLSEAELANLMLQRIENGDLALEDIPACLARYGLMESKRSSMKCGSAWNWRRKTAPAKVNVAAYVARQQRPLQHILAEMLQFMLQRCNISRNIIRR